MRVVRFQAGQSIFERDPDSEICLVLEGRVRLSVLTTDGRELTFKYAVKGEVFGEIAVLDGGSRSASATAPTDVGMISLAYEVRRARFLLHELSVHPKPTPPGPTTAKRRAPQPEAPAMTRASFDPVAFREVPGWEADDHLAAFKAFLASCPRLVTGGRGSPPKSGEPRPPSELRAACEAALAVPDKLTRVEARAFFERHFLPHRVVHDKVDGLLTGYYEPLLEGSRVREGRFQTPILKRPPDLVTIVPETKGTVTGGLTHARRTAAGLVPFATRAEIEAGALGGQSLELIYLTDPVEKFFLQIQGSGRIRLTDGTTVRVHYDGKNGHPFTSIGRYLIDKGLFAADRMSLGALGRWLRTDVERARLVMNQNASYVFFRELPSDARGPLGAIEVPLIAGRSLAVDPAIHSLGSPVYVNAPTLTPSGHSRPFSRLMVAHDVGSAIRGPERGDIYFGSGESAGRVAGTTKHPGNFYVLLAMAPSARKAGGRPALAPDRLGQ